MFFKKTELYPQGDFYCRICRNHFTISGSMVSDKYKMINGMFPPLFAQCPRCCNSLFIKKN
ncbi:MAG: hypothetical protein ACRC5H_05635 [Treponemataceae bacterium]